MVMQRLVKGLVETEKSEHAAPPRALLRVAGAGTLVALLAAGCATPTPARDPRVRPVENLAERLVFQGFSVLPPQGRGWLIIPAGVEDPRRGRTVLSLGKPLRERRSARPEELHTAGARVLVLDVQDTRFDSPEAYLRFVEEEAKRGSTGRRFRQIETRYGIEPEGPAPFCVRHETVVEDSQVPGFPGAVFVLAARGLRCVHPHWPRYLVDVSYSQRVHRSKLGRPISPPQPLPHLGGEVTFGKQLVGSPPGEWRLVCGGGDRKCGRSHYHSR